DDDVWGSEGDETEYDREMADRNWNRLQDEHGVVGYKEGISEAKEKGLQLGFDKGYAEGAEIGLALGRLQGFVR
ncbi:hypothetical protein BDK51DRAFT_23969, partial [Blyttiomyces helicus]